MSSAGRAESWRWSCSPGRYQGGEAEEIRGRSQDRVAEHIVGPRRCRHHGEIKGWNWVEKPQKQYRDKSPSGMNVSDRQGAGHKPTHYTVSVKGEQE
jgi:hypothetical protein|nr:MAG: hypothetical protein J07AB56_11020 [Candidatus Nanosalinarum sp. J07AB56]